MKKWLVGIGIGVIALVAGAFVASIFFLGGIVKDRVETIGPRLTQVDVKLDGADVWLVPGRAQLMGLSVANPSGCKTPIAIKVGEISVRMNPLSAFSDKTIIDSLTLKSPEITLEGGLKKNNLTQIQKNMNDYNSDSSTTASKPTAASDAALQSGKKFQINELVITGARLHVISLFATGKNVSISLPVIRLVNLGSGPAGITSPEVAQKALKALLNSITENAAETITNLGKEAVSKAKKFDFKKAGERLKGIFGQ